MAYAFPPGVRDPLVAWLRGQLLATFDALFQPADDLPFATHIDTRQVCALVERLIVAKEWTPAMRSRVRHWLAFASGPLTTGGPIVLAECLARALFFLPKPSLSI